MENSNTKKVIAWTFVVSCGLACAGITLISFSTVWGFSTFQEKMLSDYFSGYPEGEELTFLVCSVVQKIVTGGILASVGGCGILLCVRWYLCPEKTK